VKDLRFGQLHAQLKLEIMNLFNRTYFADPDTRVGSPTFGQVTSFGPQSPRQGQVGVRLNW
jgi:outer membrane receptor protein involved in Fe transport